ncbi:DUF4159 domain-containing protein [Algihabitans albus]|uniref:DUF4159 domain-containing protein n=1 Tax=Algihabitans albus TaxID=2164067 RepID=UPI0035D0412A
MLTLGPLGFVNPWLLFALAGLPILWWLLRVTPPAPKRLSFPAIRLLFGLQPPEETPARTPWWLIALRMLLAALVIVGLARPILNPSAQLAGSGPVVIVVDNGWAAAANWAARERLLGELLDQAERDRRAVVLATTAPDGREAAETRLSALPPAEARRIAQSIQPRPWAVDRPLAAERLRALALEEAATVVWLSDGLESGSEPDAAEFAQALADLGSVQIYRDVPGDLPRLLLPPEIDTASLILRAGRVATDTPDSLTVRASDDRGRLVTQQTLDFEPEAAETSQALTLPIELRNRITRLDIEGEAGAGAVLFLDERWRRRPVGLVSTGPLESAQPLLSELYYLERALAPFTEISRGDIGQLMNRGVAVIALPDLGPLPPEQATALERWVEAGGLLLRFAGPRLAESDDGLLPVELRRGGRIMGGALTWSDPAELAPFAHDSPFAGLLLPEDVAVSRQVLAEPALDLPEKTWAQLTDGTPLVTAEPRGQGWLALVHTTANTEWSDLPLSGLFVEMLRRIVAVSQGVSGASEAALPPLSTLDGFGRLGNPPATALALTAEAVEAGDIGPRHPPGIYGTDAGRRAHNLVVGVPVLTPIGSLPGSLEARIYAGSEEQDLLPWLLTAALVVALLDALIALALRGHLSLRPGELRQAPENSGISKGAGTAAVLVLSAVLLGSPAAQAQSGDDDDLRRTLAATLETRLAYVVTGVPQVDDISRSGLSGLSRLLLRRTAVEPADPMAVELGRDELAFFPLLYWPITPEQTNLDSAARRALNEYLSNGGTLLIDLREPTAGTRLFGETSRNSQALQRLTEGIQVPQLVPVPPEHVLTKAFYLLQDFPGRYEGGTLWVENPDEADNDGVASVVVGSNDWAGAWAIDDLGRPRAAVVPGGERQREMAYRFGVNLVMYALTGNYKADQVHVPYILERLGQ